MASPSNMSPWPGVKEPLAFAAPSDVQLQPGNVTDSEVILTRLREEIATGTQGPDVLLGAIAIAAQAMTNATGAALGIRRDGTVVCVGRSGETAPALGARLSEDSGISGECLRSGRFQRCDDTETDSRVDAEVCRDLGLRSIVAVPIRCRLETVGILEVFSTSPCSFTEEQMTQLSSLAELADAVSSPKIASAVPVEEADIKTEFIPVARPDLPILKSSWTYAENSRQPIWRYLAGVGAVLVLGLFLFASWRMLRELRSRSSAPEIATQPAVSTPANRQIPTQPIANIPVKPTPEKITPSPSTSDSPKSRGVIPASNIESEPDDGLIRNIPVNSATGSKPENSPGRSVEAETGAPPQVSMVTTNEDSLRGILAPATAMPQLEQSHSQAAIPLVLEHKVMPIYPRQALTLRREGEVVTRATVSETGKVSRVKVLSGDPILAEAAMEAIRQWRYHPALLNGVPTQTDIEITLNFKLP